MESAEQPVPIDPPTAEANEPRTRLSFKQTHTLVAYCKTLAEQTHDTWVGLAAHVGDELGFKVTTYSLQMAIGAAERDTKTFLKPAVEESSVDKRLSAQQKQIDELNSKYDLLKGVVDKILNQTVANEVA
jgi:hypothetical protein